jgi:capsular exopolysaccharide synthesis family protein
VLEHLDETITTPDDVEHKLGLALLGAIPALPRGQSVMQALRDQRSPFSEAYYSAGTALTFASDEGLPKTMLVTSTRQGEGKSTTAQTLAVNFAQLGRRVLLIDADMRNPALHKMLRIDNAAGLANVLRGEQAVEAVVSRIAPSTLFVLPSGPIPPNPAALLAGDRLRTVLEEAAQDYDVILIDGPPVMGLADATLLGAMADGVLMVVEAGGTRLGAARSAIRRLQVGRAQLLGGLLTKYNARRAGYGYAYGADYRYSYGAEAPKKLFANSRLGLSQS